MKYKTELILLGLVVVSAFLIKHSGFSSHDLVTSQILLLKKMLIETYGMTPAGSLVEIVKPYIYPLIFMFLISISMGVASTLDRKNRIITSLISSVLLVLIFHSYLGVFIGFSIFLSFLISEKSTNLGLVLFNLTLAVGIFVVLSSNLDVYSSEFESNFNSFITNLINDETSSMKNVTYQVGMSILDQEESALVYSVENSNVPNKNKIIEDIRTAFTEVRREFETRQENIEVEDISGEIIKNSKIFSAFVRWIPFSVAVQVWLFLEFLRALILRRLSEIPKILKRKK